MALTFGPLTVDPDNKTVSFNTPAGNVTVDGNQGTVTTTAPDGTKTTWNPSLPSPQDILNAINSLPSLDNIKQFIGGLPLPPPPPAPPPPIDPKLVLTQIAAALSESEKILNTQGLLIVNGTVRAEMDVKVGDLVGGHAEINIQITPKPQN